MALQRVQDMSLHQVNLLVAKLRGVLVEDYKGHVAERLEFDPEGPANAFSRDHKFMWRFYQPTEDYSLAGPIMDEEGICSMYPSKDSVKEKYSRAYYPGNNGGDVLYEYSGKTSAEAGMRTYVAKCLGPEIDFDNLPVIRRVAVIEVQGWKKDPLEITTDDEEEFFTEIVEIPAETISEAKLIAANQFVGFYVLSVRFQGWK